MEVSAGFVCQFMTEYRKQAHAVYCTQYHIVISTKYRHKVLKGGIGEYLKNSVHQIGRFHPELEILEVNTDLDHIHLLISIPPRFSVGQVVRMIKTNTGRAMRQKFQFLDKVYWGIASLLLGS